MENTFLLKGEFYDIPELKLCPVPQTSSYINWRSFKACLKKSCKSWRWMDKRRINLRTKQKSLLDQINVYREEYGTLDHPNYQFQVMGEAAYSPDGIKSLEDLGATEVIVAFRNTYEGGPDERTLEGMIAEINWYAEEVINKSK